MDHCWVKWITGPTVGGSRLVIVGQWVKRGSQWVTVGQWVMVGQWVSGSVGGGSRRLWVSGSVGQKILTHSNSGQHC